MDVRCGHDRASGALSGARRAAALFVALVYFFVGFSYQHIHLDGGQDVALAQQLTDLGSSDQIDDGSGLQNHDHCHSCFPALFSPAVIADVVMAAFEQSILPSETHRSKYRARLDTPPPRTFI